MSFKTHNIAVSVEEDFSKLIKRIERPNMTIANADSIESQSFIEMLNLNLWIARKENALFVDKYANYADKSMNEIGEKLCDVIYKEYENLMNN